MDGLHGPGPSVPPPADYAIEFNAGVATPDAQGSAYLELAAADLKTVTAANLRSQAQLDVGKATQGQSASTDQHALYAPRITIVGYTAASGPRVVGRRLARRRVAAIAEALATAGARRAEITMRIERAGDPDASSGATIHIDYSVAPARSGKPRRRHPHRVTHGSGPPVPPS